MLSAAIDLRCLTDQHGSGVATYTSLMLNALQESPKVRATQWTGFTTGRTKKELPRLGFPFEQRHVGFSNTLLNASVTAFNRPHAQRFTGAVDFLWQPNPMFFPRTSLRHYVTIHDLSFVHFPEFFAWRTRAWYLRWVRQWLASAPKEARLIAISEHTYDDLREAYPAWEGRIILQRPPPPPLRPEHTKTGAERYALAVGTLESRKNIESLLTAFERWCLFQPDLKLVLVGKPSPAWRAYYRGRVASENIRLTGYIPVVERERLYASAWCVIYPSFYEGYGLPPLEAMSFGVPVIATAVSAVPEYVGDGALLIDPYRATEEIVAAVLALSDSESLYRSYQQRGRARLQFLHDSFSLEPLLSLWYGHASV